MTDPERIADLLRRSSISVIVGETVELLDADHPRGRCPWHPDATHSLFLSERLSMFHCFACGAGGDTIKWIERSRDLDREEAVEWLDRWLTDRPHDPGS